MWSGRRYCKLSQQILSYFKIPRITLLALHLQCRKCNAYRTLAVMAIGDKLAYISCISFRIHQNTSFQVLGRGLGLSQTPPSVARVPPPKSYSSSPFGIRHFVPQNSKQIYTTAMTISKTCFISWMSVLMLWSWLLTL